VDYKDYYKILEIDKKATPEEIKKAYRALAKKNHPDKNLGDKKAEERFKLVNEANEVLGDPEKRKQYDELGENWQQNQQAYNQQQNSNRQYYQGFGGGNQEDFSDFFEQFFASRSQNSRQQQPRRGGDYETEMEISLEEAFTGTSRIIQLENEKLRVTTKPGAYTDQQLRIKSKGAKGNNDANRGDLFVRIRVKENPKFIRKGDDLHQTVNVSLYDAILGNEIIVETLSGKLKIKITPGTQNGKTIRLKAKGMPIYERPSFFGDLYILIQVQIPEKLTEKQKALFEELKTTT
jgi:curved DNA-binding protein